MDEKPKKNKFHNNLPQLKTLKALDTVKFDIESPLFSKACSNLGLKPEECILKEYESF